MVQAAPPDLVRGVLDTIRPGYMMPVSWEEASVWWITMEVERTVQADFVGFPHGWESSSANSRPSGSEDQKAIGGVPAVCVAHGERRGGGTT